jgi:hypothetical protein
MADKEDPANYLRTPDGRYFVVRGRLWRCTNPALGNDESDALTCKLMIARRQVRAALRSADTAELRTARAAVNVAKIALGERGPVWWSDGAPDYNRHLVHSTPYRTWYEAAESNPAFALS